MTVNCEANLSSKKKQNKKHIRHILDFRISDEQTKINIRQNLRKRKLQVFTDDVIH